MKLFKILLTIMFITTMISMTSCENKNEQQSKIETLEKKLENTEYLTYYLIEENEKLTRRIHALETSGNSGRGGQSSREQNEEQTISQLKNSKRKLFVMRMKLMNYQLRYEAFPETVQALKEVLISVPIEDRSGSNVIHLKKNGRGGWVYDPGEGTLEINTYNP